MKIVSLQSGGLSGGVPLFGVQVEADGGDRFTFWADGKALHNPAAFADHAAERTGKPCTSEFVGDEGGWHAHLGDMLRRSGGPAQPASNASAAAVSGSADADRRAVLLAATPLGKATAAAETAAANFVAPAAPAPAPVSFAEQCAIDADAADRARRAGLSKYLKLTNLGRDVLAADAKKAA